MFLRRSRRRWAWFAINVVRAVVGPKGEFAGIVAATLDPEYFNVLLRSVLYAPDMRAALVHWDGKAFLFMPPNARMVGADLAKPGSFFQPAPGQRSERHAAHQRVHRLGRGTHDGLAPPSTAPARPWTSP